mmetsp:Transcript_23425/g.62524  ORF Transcript_23425/g.62524 Transcript_23425/m.62524 type:complete len:217 (+) Transcript_23425:434-1084(+)
MADKRGGRRGNPSVEEHSCAAAVPLCQKGGDALLALYLHDYLQRVHWKQSNAPSRGKRRRKQRLKPCRAPAHVHVVEQGKHPSICGGVSESQHRALEKCWAEAAVETGYPALSVEGGQGLAHAHAVPVLVIHRRPQPHQGPDLQRHGHGARDPPAEGAVQALVQGPAERRARGAPRGELRGAGQLRAARPLHEEGLQPVRLHVVTAVNSLHEQRAQ